MSYTGEGFLESLGIKQPTKIASYKPRTKTSGNKDYDALYDKYGREHNVDPDLLIAQGEQESGFRSNARSKAGAEGIAQFIPSTAKEFGVNVKDPASSINGQTRLMRQLLDRTNDIELSLAGYNSGHNASIDTLRRNKERIPETRNYVKSILGKYQTPSSTLVKDLNTPSFLDAIGANDVPQKSFLDEIGATEQQPPAVQSPAIAPLVNGQKPLLDPKTIGQQTVTTQTPVMQPIQPQNTQQTDVTGILAKQPQVMAEAQRIGKQPVDILLEMAKGEHPAQQSQQPIAEQQQQWLAKNPEYAKWTKEVGVDPFDEKSIANYKDVQKQNAQIQQQRKQKVGLVQQSVKAIERPNQGYEFEQTGELFVPNAQGVQNLRFKYDKTNQEGLQKGEYRVIDEDGDSYIFSPKTGNFIDEADTTVLETIPLPKPGKDVATKAAGLRTMATTVAESIADKYQIPKKDVADYFMQYGFGDIQTGENRPDEWYFGGGANIVGATDDTYQYNLTQRGLNQIQNFSAERAKKQTKYEEGKKLAKDLGYNDYEADLAGARDAGWISKDAFQQEFDQYRKEKSNLEGFQNYFSSIKGKGGYEPTASNEQIVQQNLQNILDKYGSFREFSKEQKRIEALPLSERVAEAGRSFVAVVPKAFGAISKSLGAIDYGLSQLGLIPGQKYKDIESTPMWQSGQNFDWLGDWGKNKEAHNSWESKVADTIGQVALQAGTAWATGGIGLSSLIGLTQGGSQAVETAMKEGATPNQQLAMGIVGSVAALPDILLMKGWFKSFTGAERVGLVKKIGQSIFKEMVLKGATAKEAGLVSKLATTGFVTRAGQLGQKILFNAEKDLIEPLTVGRATTTVLKGMGGEGVQEGSENDINLIGKKYIYNPNITWGDIAKITDDDVDSITYGAIGGAFGGSIEIASHPDAFKTYKEKQAAYAAIDKGLSNHALEKTNDTTFTLGKKEYKITEQIGDTIEKYQANASAIETALKSFADIKTRAKKAKTFAQRRELVSESKTLQKEIVTLADERASLASELINQADAGESLIQETQNTSATQDTPITQNIPIVGTDVKKKVVEVKPAVEPKIEEQPQEAQSKETRPKEEQPVEQEVAKQPIDEDVEDIVNTPADTDWVNKMLGVKKPVKKKTVTKKVEAPNVLENKAPTVKPAPVKPPQPSAKRLKDLGYTSSQQKTLTTAQKAEILDKAQIDTTKPTAKGDTFNPLAVQKNTPTLPDGTKVSWTNPQGLKSQGIVKNNKVEPVNGGAGIPIEKFAEKGIELKTRGNKGLAMSPSNIIDSKGNINYEQTKDVAERIERGELTIRRLNQEVERGRLAGGRRNVEASLILAANEGASKKANALRGSRVDSVTDTSRRQEGVLEHYAKRNDIWFKQGHFPDRLYIDKGGEAIVYRKDENRVVKLLDPRQIDKSLTPQTFLDTRVSLFNYLFPESRYEVMGFMRDDNGKFRVLVTQPFIQGEPVKQQADIDAFMESRGLKRTGKQSYSNDLYEVHDLHEKNVIKGNDGTIYVIDAVPKAKHVQDFEIVENKGLAMAAKSPTGQDLIDALKQPVTKEAIQEARSKVTQYGTEMDLTTAVIANRLAKDAGVMTVTFDGAFFEPESTKKFIANVRKLAQATGAKSLEKFANAVEHQFNTEGVAVVYMSPEAGQHEVGHKLRYLNAINKGYEARHAHFDDLTNLVTDDGLDTMIDRAYTEFFVHHGYNRAARDFKGIAVEEMANYIAQGDYKKLGLTEAEAARFAILEAQSYYAANKGDMSYEEAVKKFEGMSDAMDKFLEAIRNEQTSRNIQNSERSQENRQAEVRGSEKADTEKERRFAKTLEKTGRGIFKPSTYFPDTMAGWKGEAERVINDNGIEQAERMFWSGNLSPKIKNAVGIALVDHYGQENDLDAMNRVTAELITKGTDIGQAVKALDLANRYDPQSWITIASRYKAKSKKGELTQKELDEGKQKVDTYATSADDVQLADEYLNENRQEASVYDKQIGNLDKAVTATKQLESLQAEVEILRKQLAERKQARPKATSKASTLKAEIEARRKENLAIIKAFAKESERGSFILSSPDKYRIGFEDTGLSEEVFNALKDEAVLKLLTELPRGEMTLDQFKTWINTLAKNKLSDKQQEQIMAAGVNEIRQTKEHEVTPEQLRQQANRREFYKKAYEILGEPERLVQQKNKEIEKAYQQAEKQKQKEINLLHKARVAADKALEATVKKELEAAYKEQERIANEAIKEAERTAKERAKAYGKLQREKAKDSIDIGMASPIDIWSHQLVKTAANLDVDDMTLIGANVLKATRNLSRWRAMMHNLYPDIPRQNFNEVYRKSYSLLQDVNTDLKRQRAEVQAKRVLTDEEFAQLESDKKKKVSKMLSARRELDGFYKHLSLSRSRMVGKQIRGVLNIFRTVQASMDLSYAARQGMALMGMESIESAKAFKEGLLKGLTEEEFDNFIYTMENDPIAQEMRQYGWSSRAILKNPLDFEEFYLSQVPMKLADIQKGGKLTAPLRALGQGFKASERIFELQGDLQGYYIYKKWRGLLKEAEGIDIDRAKKQLIRIINAGTGRGNLKAVFGEGGIAQDFLTEIFYSPRFLLSRPEFIAYTNPIGLALTPKGARKIVAKRSVGMWTKTALLFLPLAALGLTSLDPEDDEFMKIRYGDQTWDITGKLNEPLRGLAMMVKSGYYYGMSLSDNTETSEMGKDGLDRIANYYTDASKWAHYFRGKLSPQMSLVADRASKQDFLGRPFTWTGALATRLVPLSAQNIWNSLVYDQKESMMRNPITIDSFKENVKGLPESAKQNWARVLSSFIPDVVGAGSNSFPKEESTTADQEASFLTQSDYGKQKEEMTIDGQEKWRLKSALVRLGRMGYDIDTITMPYVTKGDLTIKDVADIEKKAEKLWIEQKLNTATTDQVIQTLRFTTPYNWLMQPIMTRNDKNREIERERLLKLLEKKANNAKKAKTLTPEEKERVQKWLPNYR